MKKIFSIDVGIVNMGVALLNGVTKEIIFADKVSLASRLKEIKSDSELLPRIKTCFFKEGSKMNKMVQESDVVLIECQMKRKMIIIQHIIATICSERGKMFYFVNPSCIKRHFGTGFHARRQKGVVVKGKKTNHKLNKKSAITMASSLYPTFMKSLTVSKRDDVADALLQARWFAEKKIN